MNAISIKQPWASLIISGQKPVENRTWRPPPGIIGMPLLIHASKRPDRHATVQVPTGTMPLGFVIGSVIVTGWEHARERKDVWSTGPICWLLRDPRPCEPFPATGQLGIFTIEPPDGII